MAPGAIVTRASRRSVDRGGMDVLAVVIALVSFAALLGAIELLDRV
jgi:hypothetical protein